jgi:hypothetical protein
VRKTKLRVKFANEADKRNYIADILRWIRREDSNMSADGPTTPELAIIDVLLEIAQEVLDALEATLAKNGLPMFDFNDNSVLYLVEQATSDYPTVALAVIPLGYVKIIRSPLLRAIGDTSKIRAMVIPCADIAQLRRAALKYGDDRARRKLFGL